MGYISSVSINMFVVDVVSACWIVFLSETKVTKNPFTFLFENSNLNLLL